MLNRFERAHQLPALVFLSERPTTRREQPRINAAIDDAHMAMLRLQNIDSPKRVEYRRDPSCHGQRASWPAADTARLASST